MAKNNNSLKRTVFAVVSFLIMIATIIFGMVYLKNEHYYLISTAIIIEAILPLIIGFERKGVSAREITVIAVFSAIAIASRAAFYMLPQVKPMAAIVIISGVVLGYDGGFLVGVLSAFVSNFFFGQGPWTPWQMAAMGAIGLISGLIFHKRKVKTLIVSVIGGLLVLIVYGAIVNLSMLYLYQDNVTLDMIINAYVSSVAYDAIHAGTTVVFLLLLTNTFVDAIDRIDTKYGIFKNREGN